jgi:hypothetical protein
MANNDFVDQVTGATIWNVNSPEAFSTQYDGADFDEFGDAGGPYASSDHDPVIVGLDLGTDDELPVVSGNPGSGSIIGTEVLEVLDGGGGRLDVAFGKGDSSRLAGAAPSGSARMPSRVMPEWPQVR